MVRVIGHSSGKAIIAGVVGIAAIIAVSIVAFALNTSPAQAAPLQGCTVNYGFDVGYPEYSGTGSDPWNDSRYRYKVLGFQVIAEGQLEQGTIIDSHDIDCTGTEFESGTPTTVNPANYLSARGEAPIAVSLGVPGDRTWITPSSAEQPPDPDWVYQNNYGRYAAFVDDGGMALINDQLMWCSAIDPDPNEVLDNGGPPLPAGDYSKCQPDITSDTYAPTHNGAGHMFIDSNCPPDIDCANQGNFNWYRQAHNSNSPDWTSTIGLDSSGKLNPFQLRMLARQFHEGGVVAFMVMTFKYPISNAECVGISTAPDQPAVGSAFSATVQIRNTGTTTWRNSGTNPFKLGSSLGRDNTDWSPVNGATTNRVSLPASIAPGAAATVSFTATRPSSSNTFAWAIVQEGVMWLDGDPPWNVGQKCVKNFDPPAGFLLHKIFMANRIDIPLSFVRDNFQFAINLMSYFWPDTGLRTSATARSNRLWLAGIWGKDGINGGDNSASDTSTNTDPNNMGAINTLAEIGCGETRSGCRERVPLAYVPQPDGAGIPTTSTKDGSTTPFGNLWLSIRERAGNVTSGYDPKEGGIASNLNNNVGGAGGSRINNVEISNIRVEAVGVSHSAADNSGGPAGGYGQAYQGLVNGSILQPDSATQGRNLPGGSQGPQGNRWDNIRNPQGGSSVYSATVFSSNLDNTNSGGSPSNFSDDPESAAISTINTFVGRARQVGAVTATSLLQDGQGTYDNKTEPITYSSTVTGVSNARLKWDEYIDWTQVDDKGHWYTTKENRPTGVSRGGGGGESYSLESFDQGSQEVDFIHAHYSDHEHCSGTGSNRTCTNHQHFEGNHTHYTQCTGSYSYRTGVSYTNNSLTYYSPSVETRHGWYNTQTTTSAMPYGGPGGTAQSAFYTSYSNSPAWSNTGTNAFWQDTNVTSMSNSGSTNKPAHIDRWIRNTADPAYNSRRIFANQNTPFFRTDWQYTYSSSCKYPNGGGAFVSSSGTTEPIYRNAQLLYENSGSGTGGTIYGLHGAGATFDGVSDGQVDVGWSWASNLQRVRYEQTYNGHYRNLGPRNIFSADDNLLYGLGGASLPGKPGRGMTTIGNPTIGASEGDIFAGGGVSSYFQSSSSSAFVFTNQYISNFSAPRYYAGYYINRDRDRVGADMGSTGDPVRYVFKNFDTELLGKAVSYPGGSNVNLDGKIYRTNGNYTINATTFCSGAGTIIVEGNLTVNGNLDYCNGTSRDNLPSVGFIVTGNVNIDPAVNFIKGAYFVNGTFSTGSYLLTGGAPNDNRTVNDSPFVLQGLIVANRFSLDRQPSGSSNVAGSSESFTYDGRIVISSPPGFSDLYNIPAVWNEGAPSN